MPVRSLLSRLQVLCFRRILEFSELLCFVVEEHNLQSL